MDEIQIPEADVDRLYERLKGAADSRDYHLNPDTAFAKMLVHSLLVNQQRYGYWCCPCRLSSGSREKDRDIICPCDYRDPDLEEYGSCYCALYVSQEVVDGKKKPGSIPERRPMSRQPG